MTEQQKEALLEVITANAIDLNELYEYLNTIQPGDFHYTNGTHFPKLISGMTADGVFASPSYYLTGYERIKGKTSFSRAKNFCRNRGTVLPNAEARANMMTHNEAINASLSAIGYPLLAFYQEYWAEEDEHNQVSYVDEDGTIKEPEYKKFVRGCVKVEATPPQIMYCTRQKDSGTHKTIYQQILNKLNVYEDQIHCYEQSKQTGYFPQAGDFLLKNGYASRTTVYDQEAGIYINANLYLRLTFPEKSLTYEECQVYCKMNNVRIPEYFELRQIAKSREAINQSLQAIGMNKYALPEDILHECWSKESLEQAAEEEKTDEKKRVLLVDKRNNVENILIILEDLKNHFLPDNQ